MAMPTLADEVEETSMEERVARLEANVKHIMEDISDIKIDVRRLTDKIDGVERSIWSFKIWALTLYVGMGAGMFTVMAHGFGWL